MHHSPLTQKSLLHLELGKASGAAAPKHRPLIWRSLMRRVPWPLIPDRSSGCRLLAFCLLAALAAPGCGHERKVPLHERLEAPDRAGDPAGGPEHRPGRRPAELHRSLRAHVDLSQADRLISRSGTWTSATR